MYTMNYNSLMQKRLDRKSYELLRSLGETGEILGYPVFIIGGFVRDLLMGRPNLDIDVVVEGDGIAFAKGFSSKSYCQILSHQRFGTAVLKFPDGFKVDIASARTEEYRHPGALPDVRLGSIKDDLYRRDFTINAIAIWLNTKKFGELVDYFGGMQDLQKRRIRVLHDLSFIDDPTRLFRAIRFEQRFGFSIDQNTQTLMEEAISKNSLKNITGQRIRNEILIILKELKPFFPLVRMSQFNLLGYIHPNIQTSSEMNELFHEAEEILNWWKSTIASQHLKADRILLNLIILLYQLDENAIEDISKRLFLTNTYIEALKSSKTKLLTALQNIENSNKPSVIYKNLKQIHLEVLLFSIAKFKNLREKLSIYLTEFCNIKPLVNGNDLKGLGYPMGPLYSRILESAFEAQLDGLVTNKQNAIDFIKKTFV